MPPTPHRVARIPCVPLDSHARSDHDGTCSITGVPPHRDVQKDVHAFGDLMKMSPYQVSEAQFRSSKRVWAESGTRGRTLGLIDGGMCDQGEHIGSAIYVECAWAFTKRQPIRSIVTARFHALALGLR